MPFGVNASDVSTILADVQAIKPKTDSLPASPADETTSSNIEALVTSLEQPPIDLWSDYTPQVILTAAPTTKSLPSIVIAGLPVGAVVTKARMMLKFRIAENTSGSTNSVSGAQNIQAENHVGGVLTTGIALLGGEFAVPATTREGGDVMMGTNDVSSQIPASGGQVDFQWTSALAIAANLNFDDVQVGLRIWYE